MILFSVLALSSCAGARTTSAEKLLAAFYSSAGSSDVSVLETKDYGKGYVALAWYAGAGGHVELFRVGRDQGGADKIDAICEGGLPAKPGYSVSVTQDDDNTVVFVYISDSAIKCTKAEFTFANGEKVSASGSGKGFIVITKGKQELSDFKLDGVQGDQPGSLAAFRDAGGSVTKTGFISIG